MWREELAYVGRILVPDYHGFELRAQKLKYLRLLLPELLLRYAVGYGPPSGFDRPRGHVAHHPEHGRVGIHPDEAPEGRGVVKLPTLGREDGRAAFYDLCQVFWAHASARFLRYERKDSKDLDALPITSGILRARPSIRPQSSLP